MRNIEIKARVPDLAPFRARAASLASSGPERLDQTDTFFTVPRGRLKVREFGDGGGELISYRRPDQPGPKESVYSRCAFPDARALADALADVLPVRGVVAKRREVFMAGRTRIHLDEVRGLGCFIELEVVLDDGESVASGEQVARELLAALGIADVALLPASYIDLMETHPATPPDE